MIEILNILTQTPSQEILSLFRQYVLPIVLAVFTIIFLGFLIYQAIHVFKDKENRYKHYIWMISSVGIYVVIAGFLGAILSGALNFGLL